MVVMQGLHLLHTQNIHMDGHTIHTLVHVVYTHGCGSIIIHSTEPCTPNSIYQTIPPPPLPIFIKSSLGKRLDGMHVHVKTVQKKKKKSIHR